MRWLGKALHIWRLWKAALQRHFHLLHHRHLQILEERQAQAVQDIGLGADELALDLGAGVALGCSR